MNFMLCLSYRVINMKSKTFFFFMIGLFLFLTMLVCLEFHYVESIDHYSVYIQKIFSNDNFQMFFLMITNFMTIFGVFFILILTSFLLRKKNAKKELFLFFISIVSCLLINDFIKHIIQRERPLDRILEVSGYSFPSAHASISMVVYGYLILLLQKYDQGKRKKFWIAICVILILLTGVSRIYFHVHYITDVIAGFSLGLVILTFSNVALKKLTNSSK